MNILNRLLDLIYPEKTYCLNCGKRIFFSEIKGLCSSCLQKINFITNYCLYCGRAFSSESSTMCKFCRSRSLNFDQARSVAIYNEIMRDLILKFKYDHQLKLQDPLSELLSLYFYEYYAQLRIEYIIPIPLHQKREKERGYNQVKLLAEGLSKRIGIAFLDNSLIRVKDSPPLYNLGFKERNRALKDSFALNHAEQVKNKLILLLDDILTTGSTVNEASLVLKKEGKAKKIYVLTLGTGEIN